MKTKSVVDICKKEKRIHLFTDDNGVQWLGDGSSLYPLHGIPELDKDTFFTIYDIPEKDQCKFSVIEEGTQINLDDTIEAESQVDLEEYLIVHGEKLLQPIQTQNGMIFIDTMHLKPVKHIEGLRYFERELYKGKTYIVVKAGFVPVAFILPYDFLTEDFIDDLKRLVDECRHSLAYSEGVDDYGDYRLYNHDVSQTD